MSIETTKNMLKYINASPTAFHAVQNLQIVLDSFGFTRLTPGFTELEEGKSYYITKNGSSLIAFTYSEKDFSSFRLASAHSDSPSFKLKANPIEKAAGGVTLLATEPYGGAIYASWADRPLSIAGRVVAHKDEKISSFLCDVKRDIALIPSVAIHFNRKVNDSASFNAQKDMLPMLGQNISTEEFWELIKRSSLCEGYEILGCELYLYPTSQGFIWGEKQEFVSCARLDDLQSVYALVCGLLRSEKSSSIPMLCIFDNEEVGSSTKQGAMSTFLEQTISAVARSAGMSEARLQEVLSRSFMVCADSAHAIHPLHPELSDPSDFPVLNGGTVIKLSAAQRYATDAYSQSIFRLAAKKAGAALQVFSNRSDMPGGSTLANISASKVSVPTVDIGLPLLAMHSCCETAGVKDTKELSDIMSVYFSDYPKGLDEV